MWYPLQAMYNLGFAGLGWLNNNAGGLGVLGSIASGLFDYATAERNEDNLHAMLKLQQALAFRGVQIRAADMRAAGINPILASGGVTNAAGGNFQAPQMNFNASDKFNSVMSIVSQLQNIKQSESVIEKNKTDSIKAGEETIAQHTENQILANQARDQTLKTDYNNGTFDQFLSDPFFMNMYALVLGQETPDSIRENMDGLLKSRSVSATQYEQYKKINHFLMAAKNEPGVYQEQMTALKSRYLMALPLSIFRQYIKDFSASRISSLDVDRWAMQNQALLNSVNSLAPEESQKFINTVSPYFNLVGDAVGTALNLKGFFAKPTSHIEQIMETVEHFDRKGRFTGSDRRSRRKVNEDEDKED